MPAPGVCLNILSERNLKEGQGSALNPQSFLGQDFQNMKRFCLRERLRFTDSLFPPESKSIGPVRRTALPLVEWRRPHELLPNPVFIAEGTSRFDFVQSDLGNCWFLASVGALTSHRRIMQQVVPQDQSFSVDYTGIFHFRFWRFGSWVDVVIDDKLPTIDGQLVFVKSKTPSEFWPALLEKAYAKVCGSYADMDAGNISEALMDFTGGPHMSIKLSQATDELWDILRRAGQSEALMGCGTAAGSAEQNKVLPNGLVEMHAYTITGTAQVFCGGRPVRLVRIFNPWGEGEWNRDWSDRSPLWDTVRPEDKKLNIVLDNGEFWMSVEDFCRHFSEVDVCCPDVNILAGGGGSSSWKSEVHRGQWVTGTTAGGCSNNLESFGQNPQFRVTLPKQDGDSRDGNAPSLLVSLMQKSHKRNRHLAINLHIGFSIYQVPEHLKETSEKFPASFFRSSVPVGKSGSFLNAREVMEFFRLPAGHYLIVPSTFKPGEASSFILSVHTRTGAAVRDGSGRGLSRKKIIPRHADESFSLFQQYADQFGEVNAKQLQRLLDDHLLTGISLDLCKSLVALMDLSVTGRLSEFECLRFWKQAVWLKEVFYRMDVSHTGTLSLRELHDALQAAGFQLSDSMLNLMALRYGDSGEITLHNFIFLVLRMDCMAKTFKRLSAGARDLTLGENEWMNLTLYC